MDVVSIYLEFSLLCTNGRKKKTLASSCAFNDTLCTFKKDTRGFLL